jgi:hypothetical protein
LKRTIPVRRTTLAVAGIAVAAAAGVVALPGPADAAAPPRAGQYCSHAGAVARTRTGQIVRCVAPRQRRWVLIAPATVTVSRPAVTKVVTVTKPVPRFITQTKTKTVTRIVRVPVGRPQATPAHGPHKPPQRPSTPHGKTPPPQTTANIVASLHT